MSCGWPLSSSSSARFASSASSFLLKLKAARSALKCSRHLSSYSRAIWAFDILSFTEALSESAALLSRAALSEDMLAEALSLEKALPLAEALPTGFQLGLSSVGLSALLLRVGLSALLLRRGEEAAAADEATSSSSSSSSSPSSVNCTRRCAR